MQTEADTRSHSKHATQVTVQVTKGSDEAGCIHGIKGNDLACYLFHQTGVLCIQRQEPEQRIIMGDSQGKGPYLHAILERGIYEQEWIDLRT